MSIQSVSISGAAVYWSVSSSTQLDALTAGLAAVGLERFAPNQPTMTVAVKAALTDLYAGPRVLIRPDRGGFSVVDEQAGALGLIHTTRLTVQFSGPAVSVSPPDDPDFSRIVAAIQGQRELVPVAALTQTLTAIVRSLGGIQLRQTGGFYWIPARSLGLWRQVMSAVNSAGPNEVSMLTTIVDDAAVAAVSAALTAEMEAEVRQMTDELATGLSERAMKRRSEQLTALVNRLKDYEASLGTTLDTLRQSLVTLETGLIASAGGAEFGGGAASAFGDFF